MWKKKWIRILLIIIAAILLIYALRFSILRGVGGFLVVNDAPKKVEVMFVLSGQAFDRGSEAAELFSKKYADRIVCTGGNRDGTMLALGKDVYECELTRSAIYLTVRDSSNVDTLRRGTSTFEERNFVLDYCKEHQVKSCMIVSSAFHTRRISWLFKKTFKKEGIDVIVVASPARLYDYKNWWQNEYGLLDVNNEYVKILYYMLKH